MLVQVRVLLGVVGNLHQVPDQNDDELNQLLMCIFSFVVLNYEIRTGV